jgi:hypothetical protein
MSDLDTKTNGPYRPFSNLKTKRHLLIKNNCNISFVRADIVKQIEDDSLVYVKKAAKLAPVEKTSEIKTINGMLDKAQELSEDKIQLAMQTYEMVDKHIRRLDSELARLENELKEKQLNVSTEEKSKKRGKAKKKKGPTSFHPKNVIKEENEKGRKRHKGSAANQTMDHASNGLAFDTGSGLLNSEVLDMPVDPNEPTYCVCHQVSYGEMIGCDNLDCPIEWFHFGCVGLTQKPKGKWYCSKCIVDKKKGKN